MLKAKVLRRALALHKSGISREMCAAVIYDLCKDSRDPQNAAAFSTIDAFYETLSHNLKYDLERMEGEYTKHLEICSRQKS
jgi:hypothetical protein